MTKTYQDGNVLNESNLDDMKNSTETFLNTTKIDSDNIQSAGVNKDRLATAVQNALPPAGTVVCYAGSTLPSGWLWCDGSEISRTTYADLFTAISTTYGNGDGSTTFDIPDLRGRTIFGLDNMDNTVGTGGGDAGRLTSGADHGVDGDTLGSAGGVEEYTLVTGDLPSHNHSSGTLTTGAGSAHTHKLCSLSEGDNAEIGTNDTLATRETTSGAADNYVLTGGGVSADTGNSGSESSHTHSVTGGSTGSTGSGDAHTNLPPAIVMNWIIKT